MMRIHLVTSRAPIAGAVAARDAVVLIDTDASQQLSDEILRSNPCMSETTLLEIDEIGYARLVALVAESEGVISW